MSDLLGMSDEDFAKLNEPGPAPANDSAATDNSAAASVVEDGNETANEQTPAEAAAAAEGEDGDEDAGASGSDADAGQDGDEEGAGGEADGAEGSDPSPGPKDGEKAADADPKDPTAADGKPDPKDGDKPAGDAKDGAEPAVTVAEPPNYEALFKELMKPFKANGKTVEPRTPEEVIRLMQMGAGFGRKLQDIQPHIKTIRMLEKENLLDPTELSYLIDLRNKNPDAIKKLIKESNIDPLDLNMEDNVDYKPVNRSVSDAEVAFEDALANLKDRPSGTETIQIINQTWDKESLALVWEQPELLDIFQTQRENGVYDKIVAEIEHRKTFGKISPKTPFIQAYQIVGDELHKSGGLVPNPPAQTAAVTETNQPAAKPQVLGTRTQPLKPAVINNDKAKAAAPTQSSTKKAAAVINPLQMSDDDFLKTFEGRL